jgi:hypothetical protein
VRLSPKYLDAGSCVGNKNNGADLALVRRDEG